MTHLQFTNDDTSTTNISYGMYKIHRSSTALSYEQQDCFLLGEDVGAAIVMFRVQLLTVTQTQTISTNGWSHYTHITLYDIGALAAWSCCRSLSKSVMSWMRPSSSKSLKTTHNHKHLLRNIHAYQQMESNTLMLHNRCNKHNIATFTGFFPPLCRILPSSWQRTHQHWFTTTIHLQTAMQTLTTSNAFTDKQQSAMHYRQYKQTLQASATHKLMVIHTEPAQWDWWEHVNN